MFTSTVRHGLVLLLLLNSLSASPTRSPQIVTVDREPNFGGSRIVNAYPRPNTYYAPPPTQPFYSPQRDPAPPPIPAPRSGYRTCVDRGKKEWRTLVNSLQNPKDVSKARDKEKYYTVAAPKKVDVPLKLQEPLRARGIETTRWDEVVSLKLLHDTENPNFHNLYNARVGGIIAVANFRDIDVADPPHERLDWAEEAILKYSRQARADGVSVEGLKYVIQEQVINEVSYFSSQDSIRLI